MKARRRAFPFRLHPVTAAVATVFGFAPGLALAQEVVAQASAAPPATEDAIEEITVTATRRRESVQDIPLNITAISGNAIAEQKLENLADLVRVVPGLFLVDQGGRDQNLLTVRGLSVDALTSSEGVGTDGGGVVAQYIGDVPLYIDLRLKDLERVEALLGPQGTLYGAGTLGGAIRYLPNRPKFGETSLEVQTETFAMSHSDDFGFGGELIGNLPLADRLAVRALFGVDDEPGFIDQDFLLREPGVSDPEPDFGDPAAVAANLDSRNDVNDLRTTYGRLALRWGITDNIESTLSYHFQEQESGGRTINHSRGFGTGRYVSAERYLEPNDRRYQLGSLEVQFDLGFATLTSATGYSDYDEQGQRDQTELLLNFEYGYEDFPSFSAYTAEDSQEIRISQEVRLVSNGDGRVSWIVGGFYNEFELDATSEEFVPGFPEFAGIDRPDNLEYLQLTEQESTEKAVFGELGFAFTDKLKLTVGARFFDFEDKQAVGFALPLVDGSAPDEILIDPERVKVSDDDTIFKGNLSYQFTPDVLGYVTVSEGYRIGGSNAVPACQDPLPPGQNVCALPNERLVLPDKTLNHELGLRTTALGGRLIVNAALYYIEWDDIQVDGTTVNGNIPITVNAAKAESKGIELSMQARLGERWNLDANYAYNKAELTEDAPGIVGDSSGVSDDDSACGPDPDDDDACDGDRLPGSPEQQFHAGLGFTQPLSNGMKFKARYGIASQSNVLTRVGRRNDGEALGGYTLHDASMGLETGTWSLKFYAKNLFDKYAVTGVRASTDPYYTRQIGEFTLRSRYDAVLEPMRVGLVYTYRFGI